MQVRVLSLPPNSKYIMDFIVFKTNHDMEYAINIAEVVAIINPGPITRFPGAPTGVVGMVPFQGNIIAVVDTAELYFGSLGPTDLMLVVQSTEKYGILIKSIGQVMRGEIPDGVRFIDPHDYMRSVLGFEKDAVRIELF